MFNNAKRIYIIGSVGSGKTTYAKKLSIEKKIKHYELDELVWKRNYPTDIKRTDKEIDLLFEKVIKKSSWIIEDTGRERFSKGIECADLIIFFDININVRRFRILKRWIKQKIGIENKGHRPTLDNLKQMYRWNNLFEERKSILLQKIDQSKAVIIILDKNYN